MAKHLIKDLTTQELEKYFFICEGVHHFQPNKNGICVIEAKTCTCIESNLFIGNGTYSRMVTLNFVFEDVEIDLEARKMGFGDYREYTSFRNEYDYCYDTYEKAQQETERLNNE